MQQQSSNIILITHICDYCGAVHLFNLILSLWKALGDIEIAVKMVKASQDSEEHPLDRQYRSLHCQMQPVDSGCEEFKVWAMLLTSEEVMGSLVWWPIKQNVFIVLIEHSLGGKHPQL